MWAEHAALEGPPLQRVAAMRARVAASHTCMMVRRGDIVALHDAVVAAVDHARVRIPANVAVAAPAISRARARARAGLRRFSARS